MTQEERFSLDQAVKRLTQSYPCEINKAVVLDEALGFWAGRVTQGNEVKGVVIVVGDETTFLFQHQIEKLKTLLDEDKS